MKILFDAMGTQIQVQQETGTRLNTWFQSLKTLGCEHSISDPAQPLAPQLQDVDVYVSLTRQAYGGEFPSGTCFSYTPQDLGTLQSFVQGGGSVLMFTNHSFPVGQGPLWPIFEIQLAASLGIQLVFAEFVPRGCSPWSAPGACTPRGMQMLSMGPGACAPPALVQGVSTVQAWDSGGIVVGKGTAVIPLPGSSECYDMSGLGYSPDECAFGACYRFGSGKVIVLGHSGIVADDDTCKPSGGQIGFADNLTFVNNCITFLAA